MDDFRSCNCKNVCIKKSGRGACPCAALNKFCNEKCSCGNVNKKKLACCNIAGEKSDTLEVVADKDTSRQVSDVRAPVGRTKAIKRCHETMATATATARGGSEVVINSMSENKLREFARRALGIFPSLSGTLRELCDDTSGSRSPPQPNPLLGRPSWCHCNRCRVMPLVEENVCCRNADGPCTTYTNRDILQRVMLDQNVLEIALLNNNDLMALDDALDNENFRFAAYRQYVLWKFGYLGGGNRVVIPSCVVCLIRDTYPSPDGVYTGFKAARY